MKKTALFLGAALVLTLSILETGFGQNTETTKSSTGKTDENVLFKEENFTPLDLKGEADRKIYLEMPLEDFESGDYGANQVNFRFEGHKQAYIKIRSDYPAPIKDSKKYLGIKVFGKKEDAVAIYPIKPIIIDEFCYGLNLWAYGKGFSGRLSIIVKDSDDNTHYLTFGQLNFRGWRKLSIKIPSHVKQQDHFLNQKSKLRIVSFVFNPGNITTNDQWSYVYLDDVTAIVRTKYTDRQSDNW